jgi:Mycothiol maleylpyruvate isomerase N-terminal domain
MVAGGTSSSSLQSGYIELAGIVRALHGDWTTPVPGYEGWTCRDLLAHLSSSAASLPAVASSVTEPKDPNAPLFDPDRWNASQVRRRVDKEPQELIDEYDVGTTRLVTVLSDLNLDTLVTIGPYAGRSLGETMAEMLEHQRRHLADLREALTS